MREEEIVPKKRGNLILTDLHKGLPGITGAFGAVLAQAGAVCFESQEHQNGVELSVRGAFNAKYEVRWQEVTDQMRRCFADANPTTEHGAVGVAFLLILDLTKYTVVERSRNGSGFDYWLGEGDEPDQPPFQNKARLEVSGIRAGDDSRVKTRSALKADQVRPSDNSGLPAYVVIVEFSAPLSEVVKK